MPIINRIAEFHREMTQWRQDLHAHPELALQETRTSGVVQEKLNDFGVDEIITGLARTGVVGVIRGNGTSERAIGLRADMDALPIREETGAPYASQNAGIMHACGHDGHTTMLLGAAKYLAETRNFDGTVYVIFQPAEENLAGGDIMVREGLSLADPRKAADLAGFARADAAMLRKLGFGLTAGRNRLQGPLVPGKQRAWTRPVPLEAVKTAGAATGSTINDVMLTAITSALRRYLLEHDASAEEVIVIVPVSLRPARAPVPAGLGNEFGLVFVRLPTGETDQGRRRARVKAQDDQVKSSREGIFVYTMLQWMGQLPAAVQNAWIDAFAGKATAIVTNVSGPRHQVQIAGTPVAGMAGWVPVTGPLGLGLSIVSYAGQLSVGLASDTHLVPDHDRLLALLDDEIGALHTPAASSSPPKPGS